MSRSRTIKTLAALLGALTLGTFALFQLETLPARPPVGVPLSGRQAASRVERRCLDEILNTAIPLRQQDWRHIVIHDDVCPDAPSQGVATGVHFVIHGRDSDAGDGTVRAAARWQRQADGSHIFLSGKNYNAKSIGILLAGDCAAKPPSAKQIESLAALVRSLQGQFGIGGQYVYLHGDLTGARCPGRRMPAEAFRRQLASVD